MTYLFHILLFKCKYKILINFNLNFLITFNKQQKFKSKITAKLHFQNNIINGRT